MRQVLRSLEERKVSRVNDLGYNRPEGHPYPSRASAKFLTAELSSFHAEICLLSNNVNDYYFVSQGKTTIPNVDDGEECLLTDVRTWRWRISQDSRLLFISTTLVYDTLEMNLARLLTTVGGFLGLTIYHVAWRNCSRQFVTPLERGIVGEMCLSRSIFSIESWTMQFILHINSYILCLLLIDI